VNRRVASFQDKSITLFHFWPSKWLLQCIQGQSWNCQNRAEPSDQAEVLLGGGRRLVGCGQILLASNSKANGLNDAILSQDGKVEIFLEQREVAFLSPNKI
jgi:hypothetical protein